jgi:hypothetical protein
MTHEAEYRPDPFTAHVEQVGARFIQIAGFSGKLVPGKKLFKQLYDLGIGMHAVKLEKK